MSAVGPNVQAQTGTEYNNTAGVTPASGDQVVSALFTSGFARRVYCNGAGVIFIARSGDGTPSTPTYTSYTVVAGTALPGNIVAVGGTTRGTTVSSYVLEL